MPPRRLVVVESETAEPIALVAWVSGARPVAWGPLFRRAALFRSRDVARVGGHGWSLGLIAERGRALGAAEAEICAFCDPERGTAVLVHGSAPGVVKTLSAPFQRVCAALRLGSALLHAFDVVLAPSAQIDADPLSGGVFEALRSAQLVLEEPCYVFEVSGDVSELQQKCDTDAWAANRASVEPLGPGRTRVCLPVVEQPLVDAAVRALFGPRLVPEGLEVQFRTLECGETAGIDALRREASGGVVGVGQLGELLENRLV